MGAFTRTTATPHFNPPQLHQWLPLCRNQSGKILLRYQGNSSIVHLKELKQNKAGTIPALLFKIRYLPAIHYLPNPLYRDLVFSRSCYRYQKAGRAPPIDRQKGLYVFYPSVSTWGMPPLRPQKPTFPSRRLLSVINVLISFFEYALNYTATKRPGRSLRYWGTPSALRRRRTGLRPNSARLYKEQFPRNTLISGRYHFDAVLIKSAQ